MKKILFVALLLFSFQTLSGQEEELRDIKIRVNSENKVELKWYADNAYTPEDVNIYRRSGTSGDWELVSKEPVKTLSTIEEEAPGFKLPNIMQIVIFGETYENLDACLEMGIYYKDETAITGETYQYRIMLIGAGGSQSEFGVSEPIKVEYIPLAPPQDIVHRGFDSLAYFNWKVQEDRFFSVNVYRSDTENGEYELMTKEPAITLPMLEDTSRTQATDFGVVRFKDSLLTVNKTYFYKLQTKGFFSDESELSDPIPVLIEDTSFPPGIADLVAAREDNVTKKVFLAWTPVDDKRITGYVVRRGAKDTLQAISPVLPKTAASFTDEVPGYSTYYYQVYAVVKDRDIQVPSNFVLALVPDAEPPAPPSGVVIEGEEGVLEIRWNANTESDLEGYNIYRNEASLLEEEMLLLNNAPLKETVFRDTMPKVARNSYVYRVASIDTSFNMSPKSVAAFGRMPDVTPPPVPTIMDVSRIDEEGKQIQVTWLLSREGDIGGYELKRAVENDTSKWQNLGDFGIKDSVFVDSKIILGEAYSYKILSKDTTGNKSNWSNIYSVQTKAPIPIAGEVKEFRTNFKKKKKEIRLSWKPDEGQPMIGSIVYRSEGDGSLQPYSSMLTNGKFIDEKIEEGKAYSYQVRVFYQTGTNAQSEIQKIETPLKEEE